MAERDDSTSSSQATGRGLPARSLVLEPVGISLTRTLLPRD